MSETLEEEGDKTNENYEKFLEVEKKNNELLRKIKDLEDVLEEYESEIEQKEKDINSLKEVIKSEREVYKKVQGITSEVKKSSTREKEELLQRIAVLEAKIEKLRKDRKKNKNNAATMEKSQKEVTEKKPEKEIDLKNENLLKRFLAVSDENGKLRGELKMVKEEHQKILTGKRNEMKELRTNWEELYADSLFQTVEIQNLSQQLKNVGVLKQDVCVQTDPRNDEMLQHFGPNNQAVNISPNMSPDKLMRQLLTEQEQNKTLNERLGEVFKLYDETYKTSKLLEKKCRDYVSENTSLKLELAKFIERLESIESEKEQTVDVISKQQAPSSKEELTEANASPTSVSNGTNIDCGKQETTKSNYHHCSKTLTRLQSVIFFIKDSLQDFLSPFKNPLSISMLVLDKNEQRQHTPKSSDDNNEKIQKFPNDTYFTSSPVMGALYRDVSFSFLVFLVHSMAALSFLTLMNINYAPSFVSLVSILFCVANVILFFWRRYRVFSKWNQWPSSFNENIDDQQMSEPCESFDEYSVAMKLLTHHRQPA